MTLSVFFRKVRRKLMKLRLQPIRVYCLHHVCKYFDADSMYPCDWLDIEIFKNKIKDLQLQGYQFISLSQAHKFLQNDWIRTKKYAVLTFDDGYKSLLEVLPWLEEQRITSTLFVNGKYLDGKSYRENPKEQYLTYDELFAIKSHLIEIGHHGWEHTAASEMSDHELIDSLEKNMAVLSSHPRYIPFWAYTWGRHNKNNDELLFSNGIVPVLIEGNKNYKWIISIDREII